MMGETAFAFVRAVVRCFMRVFLPFEAAGAEYVPDEGAVILCANHESLSDPIALICSTRRWVRYMGKKELFGVWGLGALLRGLGAFPVDRGQNDLGAVRTSLAILKEGGALGIFPQGRRAYKGAEDFHSGVSLIALRSRAPVIPVFISGRARLFRKVRLTFGPPVDLGDFAGHMDSHALTSATERIKRAIYSLGKS